VDSEALVLFAHGSRDPKWAAPFRAVRQKIAAARPGLRIELAFLEMMQPSLPDAIDRLAAAGHTRLVVAPLFMAQGAHLKRDLAQLLASAKARHSHIDVLLLPAAGETEPVLDAIGAWVTTHV
jgi:sirohydrochlorin cobaltochelatase